MTHSFPPRRSSDLFCRQYQACVYEANGVWHGYLMSDSGIADTITDDREEDQVGDGLGFGERELSFPTAEEMIAWIDNGYPIEKAAKIAASQTILALSQSRKSRLNPSRPFRSEERTVGKKSVRQCRSRWAPDTKKKKQSIPLTKNPKK